MTNFVPVHAYIRKHNTSKQNVYRWIREGKINPNDFFFEEKVVRRIRIKEDSLPNYEKNGS